MGLLAFVIFCFIVLAIAWVATWVKLLQVTGILSHDPVIPHV
jgi:hypothetical protein